MQSEDIRIARGRTNFNVEAHRSILWQPGRRKAIDELIKILQIDPVFDKDERRHMSRQQLVEQGYRLQLRLVELRKLHHWNHETFLLAMSLIDDHVPFGLHFNTFIPVLESQGSDEQISEWLPKCHSLEVIGAYAQTELGMGTCRPHNLAVLLYKVNTMQLTLYETAAMFRCWRLQLRSMQ